jgi:hypothetical protein
MLAMSSRLLASALLGFVLLIQAPAFAHNGADDEAPATASPVAGAPRTEAESTEFELVAVAKGPALVITLDHFATNEPITNGTIEVAEGDSSLKAEAQEDGTYLLRAPWVGKPGKHDLTFTVAAGDASDLLTATLDIPDAHPAGSGTATGGSLAEKLLGAQRGPVTLARHRWCGGAAGRPVHRRCGVCAWRCG